MMLRLRLYRVFLKLTIYLLAIPAFFLGWWLWVVTCHFLYRPVLYFPGQISQVLFGTFVWVVVSEHYKVTSFDELFRERTGARNASSACIATSFIALATLYFGRDEIFPRGLLVFDVLALLALTIVVHAAFRVLCRSRAQLAKPIRLLIVGADEFAANAADRLRRLTFAPCEIKGYVRLPGQKVFAEGSRIYELHELEKLTNGNAADEAIIAIHPTDFHQLPKIVMALGELCLPARAVVDLGEGVAVREQLFQMGNLQMLDLTSTPAAESLDYALLKRAFDIAFAAIVISLGAPLLALIALLVKITSPGPVLFVQERVGLNGQPFRMYKFRSMRIRPESESDTTWTTDADPRRTWLGAFLRKTSLDELPQFLNVLRGDMSVVGPRPERPHFVSKFLQNVACYNNRHALKVGITGWAQVNGWRGDTSIEKRVEYDLYYLQNWTFGFDLRIIAMTVLSTLVARNAY